MYQNKITLTPQEILEKDFKIDTRGYRLKEVDQFLDVIIGDYEQFFIIIDSLEKEKAEYNKDIDDWKSKGKEKNDVWMEECYWYIFRGGKTL